MSTHYDDGDFSVAAPNGGKSRFYPFEGDSVSFFTEQEFIQSLSRFEALPLNSIDPDDHLCYLIKETDPTDIGGGLVKFIRSYSRIPSTRNDYETVAYTFPGYAATVSNEFTLPWNHITVSTFPFITDPGRAPIAREVTSRLQYDYFLVGMHGQYNSAASIPSNSAQRFVFGNTTAWGNKPGQDLPDRIIYPATLGVPAAASISSPTLEAWKALVAAGSEIVVADSAIRRWRGNIFERVTRYVKAQ